MRKTYLTLGSLGFLLAGAMLVGSPVKAAGNDSPAAPHVRECAPIHKDFRDDGHRNDPRHEGWDKKDWRELFALRNRNCEGKNRPFNCNSCDRNHPNCQNGCNDCDGSKGCDGNRLDDRFNGLNGDPTNCGCGNNSGCPSCSNS